MEFPPSRIICLTEETVETLYLLGEEDRIVGVSGYAVRPACVRKEKPRVSAFTSANIPKIRELRPDIIFTFSDLRSDIVAELIKEGFEVHCFNQRDIKGIFGMIETVGALVGRRKDSLKLVDKLKKKLDELNRSCSSGQRLRVYFEEWDEPMISAIRWVSELIEIAGGADIFKNISCEKSAKNRIVKSEDVIISNPEVIIASWCGKKVRSEKIWSRAGWSGIEAVKKNQIHEIKSPLILQPGPAALTDGVDAIHNILQKYK